MKPEELATEPGTRGALLDAVVAGAKFATRKENSRG